MQLRNGKTTVKATVNTKVDTKMSNNVTPFILFIREAKSLLDELNEQDVNSARVAGLLEFYEYTNQHLPVFKANPLLTSFIGSIKKVVPNHMEELVGIIRKNGDDIALLQTIDNLMHEMIRMIVIVS